MLDALGDAKGRAWARGRQNGLDCTPVGAGALICLDPLIQGTFISELLDLRLRKVTVELLTGLLLRSLLAPSKEGPADYIPQTDLSVGVLTVLYKGPCLRRRSVDGCRSSFMYVKMRLESSDV